MSSLLQRFSRPTEIIYFDTACQVQLNALHLVPWLLHDAVTTRFIDRFHPCNHKFSPVFDADEYPEMTRGHNTSGAERQNRIKKKDRNILFCMKQAGFLVWSRLMAARNNIRLSQRRSVAPQRTQDPSVARNDPMEMQHFPVQTYYHSQIVAHSERRVRLLS